MGFNYVVTFIAVSSVGEASKKIINSIGMEQVRVEPGSFIMGFCNEPFPLELINEKWLFANGDPDEHPSHRVTITKAFYTGAYEVTNTNGLL